MIQPESNSSPFVLLPSSVSPVSAFISNSALSLRSTPSTGIRSPVFTMSLSPICTSSGEISNKAVLPSVLRSAVVFSLFISINVTSEPREASTAIDCKVSPSVYNSITATPSNISPKQTAPTEAIVIRKFSSNIFPFATFLQVATHTENPTDTYAMAYAIYAPIFIPMLFPNRSNRKPSKKQKTETPIRTHSFV